MLHSIPLKKATKNTEETTWMKVVLFCGGLGMRLYPTTEATPKPLVPIGEKPLLWYLMKYYSFFGHSDFILCLGYKGEQIKRYFLDYEKFLSNDFVLSPIRKKCQLLKKDIEKWRITFVDTGLNSNIGHRLELVQRLLEDDEMFLANYSDAVTDLYLPKQIDFFTKSNKTACLLTVKPFYSYHAVSTNSDGIVKDIRSISKSNISLNGGFFIFKNAIFDYIGKGQDLVDEPFKRLIKKKELVAYKHNGFWANMDTYKDKQQLDEMASSNKAFWEVWKN
jgi:glucose-1-phosphate cytidylyltransferase